MDRVGAHYERRGATVEIADLGSSSQVAHHFKDFDKGGEFHFEWRIVCTMKRPLPPA